jgi:TonB family protein
LGEGLPQDVAQSFRWYRMAAEQGHGVGQLKLAKAYLDGSGVEKNSVKALVWYWVATASAGTDQASLAARAEAERSRNALRDQLTAMENGEAVRMAFSCSLSKFTQCDGPAPGLPTARAVPIDQAILPGDYPEISIRLQEQGTVGVRVMVAADGAVRECLVALSSGKKRLDDAVCAAVNAHWRYEAAVENGVAVESVHDTTVVFSLPPVAANAAQPGVDAAMVEQQIKTCRLVKEREGIDSGSMRLCMFLLVSFSKNREEDVCRALAPADADPTNVQLCAGLVKAARELLEAGNK